MTLGQLCFNNQLWGQAKHYIESSLKIATKPEHYMLLGQIFEQLNDKQKAEQAFRDGLQLATTTKSSALSIFS